MDDEVDAYDQRAMGHSGPRLRKLGDARWKRLHRKRIAVTESGVTPRTVDRSGLPPDWLNARRDTDDPKVAVVGVFPQASILH